MCLYNFDFTSEMKANKGQYFHMDTVRVILIDKSEMNLDCTLAKTKLMINKTIISKPYKEKEYRHTEKVW